MSHAYWGEKISRTKIERYDAHSKSNLLGKVPGWSSLQETARPAIKSKVPTTKRGWYSPLSGINNCPLTNNIDDISNVVYNDICKDLISSHFQTSK